MTSAHNTSIHAYRRCRGVTLMELLLTIASTALIAMAIATMLAAVSYGTQTGKDMRTLVVKNKVISARLTAAVRNARTVLETGSNYMVLWINDDNVSGTPNLGEIQYIEFDSANTRIRSYNADWTGKTQAEIDALNTSYALNANFQTSTAAVRGQTYFPAKVWLTDTSAWAVTLNNATAQLATLVSYRITVKHSQMNDIVVGAAALRNTN